MSINAHDILQEWNDKDLGWTDSALGAMQSYADERCIELIIYLSNEGINFERATDTPKNIYNDFKKVNHE